MDNAPFTRQELLASSSLRVWSIEGMLREPTAFDVELGENQIRMALGHKGTLLMADKGARQPRVLSGEYAWLLCGPVRVRQHFGRGVHSHVIVEWNRHSFAALQDCVERTAGAHTSSSYVAGTNLRCNNVHTRQTIRWATDAVRAHTGPGEYAMWACIAECVAVTQLLPSPPCLAGVAQDAPEPLRMLVEEVRTRPTERWSLRDAASFAGYSPFHLSRTFRTIFDFGFPEFVDRCRTEHAVEMLLASDQPIEEVSAASGFGSTQAMREAFKEFMGLLPSEMRSLGAGLQAE